MLSSKGKSLLCADLPHLTLGVYLPIASTFRSMTVLICRNDWTALHDEVLRRCNAREQAILKQQIAGLQEEFKRNESCWHAAYGKLRDQVEMLTRQNMELRDELRVSEHQRQKAEKNPEAVNFMDRKSETPVLDDTVCLLVSEKFRCTFSLELSCVNTFPPFLPCLA
uniref:Uncharacterized protein n=1 Tax=Calidris pygmaea TaxID=425635 RepID=A0A8C3JPS4_9CHAR